MTVDRLETILIEAAANRQLLTYQQVAHRLELQPPLTIHRTVEMLEAMMRLHALTGAPQLASVVVSRARAGLPAPGFFSLLHELGLYSGPLQGEAARRFHEIEVERCFHAASAIRD